MKRILSILMLLAGAANADAQQTTIQQVASQIGKQQISLNYSYAPADRPSEKVKGRFSMNGLSFELTAGSTRIICDGKTRWTMDGSTKEVYVEPAGKLPSWMKNPNSIVKAVSGLEYGEDSIKGIFTSPEDKHKYNFTLSGISPTGKEGPFSLDTGKLDPGWIVTDLR